MAKMQFLTILLTVACFLSGVVAVTDNEFKVCPENGEISLRVNFLIQRTSFFGTACGTV